jgi:hypothetical protein
MNFNINFNVHLNKYIMHPLVKMKNFDNIKMHGKTLIKKSCVEASPLCVCTTKVGCKEVKHNSFKCA